MFIKVEILESGIELTDKDLDESIPKKLRTTKLTERERHYFSQYKEKWNNDYNEGKVKYEF